MPAKKAVMLSCVRKTKGVIPKHKALAIGTLRSAIRQAGISPDEFVSAYKNK